MKTIIIVIVVLLTQLGFQKGKVLPSCSLCKLRLVSAGCVWSHVSRESHSTEGEREREGGGDLELAAVALLPLCSSCQSACPAWPRSKLQLLHAGLMPARQPGGRGNQNKHVLQEQS